jgi:hypothetical protein
MDRLMSSYGQNILGSLFWAVNQPANKVATIINRYIYLSVYFLFFILFGNVNGRVTESACR